MNTIFENNLIQDDLFIKREYPPIQKWIMWNEAVIDGTDPENPYYFQIYRIILADGVEHAIEASHDADPGFTSTRVSFIHRNGTGLRPTVSYMVKEKDRLLDEKFLSEIYQAMVDNELSEMPKDLIDDIAGFFKSLM